MLATFTLVTGGTNTRWTTAGARTGLDEFAGEVQENVMGPIKWFAEADPPRVSVVEV